LETVDTVVDWFSVFFVVQKSLSQQYEHPLAAQRLKLGRFFGIELFVHWTFGLVVAYVAFTTYSDGGTPAMIAFSVSQLLAVFACVTLHEYGHSLAARRFGVETVDITLLPIGGVARLTRIPRVPMQELIIAVAGPAVNVCIAIFPSVGLMIALSMQPIEFLSDAYEGITGANAAMQSQDVEPVVDKIMEPSLLGFVGSLLVINVFLVLFNMIPAFPMDGGRVLRSILAMALPYGDATRWAQRIGVVCAALMIAFAVSTTPPQFVMLAIAAFIVYAGHMETRQVETTEQLRELTVGDVMSRLAPSVSMDWTMPQLQQWWRDQPHDSAAVVSSGNVVVGMLSVADLVTHLKPAVDGLAIDRIDSRLTAGQIASHDVSPVMAAVPLESILGEMSKYRQLPVVDEGYHLIGWLDFDTILARAAMARASKQAGLGPASTVEKPADYLFLI